jgi:hypothetical protein
MKKYFNLILYLSLAFLVLSLYRADYLKVPHIHSYHHLLLSLVLLCIGFLLEALCWKKTLDNHHCTVSYRNALISTGLSIFGKYIPGKVWMMLGRSSYIAERYGYKKSDTVYIALVTQLILIWTGLLTGAVCLSVAHIPAGLLSGAVMLFAGISLVLFSGPVHSRVSRMISTATKKRFVVPLLDIVKVLRLTPYFIVRWTAFSISFYFLVNCLSDGVVSPAVGFCFPLAGTVGLVVFFAPGGIGVREGIIAAALISAGLTAVDAATVSIAARLWYCAGEFFIFFTALPVRLTLEKMSGST